MGSKFNDATHCVRNRRPLDVEWKWEENKKNINLEAKYKVGKKFDLRYKQTIQICLQGWVRVTFLDF